MGSICTPSPPPPLLHLCPVRCSCAISLNGSREWSIEIFNKAFHKLKCISTTHRHVLSSSFPGNLNNITAVYVWLSENHHLMFCYIWGLHGDDIKNVAVCKVVNRCWHFEEMQCPPLQPLWTQMTSKKKKFFLYLSI